MPTILKLPGKRPITVASRFHHLKKPLPEWLFHNHPITMARMKTTYRIMLLAVALFIQSAAHAQWDSCALRISLLTCSPGTELYSTFGHTAIRVTDTVNGRDVVFNYGTFDDSDPYFYLKFTRGIMVYALSAESFDDFMQEYISEKRSVVQQVLALSCTEKGKLLAALQDNLKEEHRFYNYHFYADNCTTRARDIIRRHTSRPVVFNNILPSPAPSYRQIIHTYLDQGGQDWSRFGIDLLLGSHLDERVTTEEAMFLPDMLLKGLDSARQGTDPLVAYSSVVLAPARADGAAKNPLTPLLVFSLLALIIVVVSVVSIGKHMEKPLLIFDRVFFALVGLLGLLILFVWLGRVDSVCRNNLNLAWALPTHLFAVFFLGRRPGWLKGYWLFSAIVCGILLACWAWLPQGLNPAFMPLLIIILVRSIFISTKTRH